MILQIILDIYHRLNINLQQLYYVDFCGRKYYNKFIKDIFHFPHKIVGDIWVIRRPISMKVVKVTKTSAIESIRIISTNNNVVVVSFERPAHIVALEKNPSEVENNWWKIANNQKLNPVMQEKALIIAYTMKYANNFGLTEMKTEYSDDTVKVMFSFRNIQYAVDFATAMKDREFWRGCISL